jgi:hypothetical protein
MSDLAVGGDGWFQLWANGPVTPAAMTLVIFNLPEWSPMELIVPLEPAEIEPAVAEAAPPTRVVEVEAAPEGGDTAAEAKLEAHLSLPEAMAWFEATGPAVVPPTGKVVGLEPTRASGTQLANRSGVSPSSVSSALNHQRKVSSRRPRAGWAWLAGGDGFVLATVPSEASFLGGLGMWVGGMAIVSGFAMTVAASQWWSTSIASVLWVLPLWAVLYCLIERLVLKSFGTSRIWNLVIAIPRLVLSLAIALVVGLPMAQVIYSGSINDELSKTRTTRIHEATNEITRLYDARIASAQKEIAAAQGKEASLQRQVTNSRFLSECEAGEASCSQTHKLGCGPYCKRDARRAAAAAAALKKARPHFAATIAADRRKIELWQAAESEQIANRVAAIKADRDFLARQAALERVEKANPSVTKYVEFFLAFLIAIDLVALVLKLTHLLSTSGAYERSAAALRATDLVDAHRLQERAAVLTHRITLEARAEEDADELRIRGDAQGRRLDSDLREQALTSASP